MFKPNIQNILIRTAEGQQIRKAVEVEIGKLPEVDFGVIEQRVLAHMEGRNNMTTYAVAFMDFSSNELKIELIQAATWLEAAKIHSRTLFQSSEQDEYLTTVSDAKQHAFDCDGGFDIVEIQADFGYDIRVIDFSPEVLGEVRSSEGD
jgi:hypothetical protein